MYVAAKYRTIAAMSTAINTEGMRTAEETMVMTRRERRTERQLRFVTTREARLAARLARLDYKVSGETGALKVPTKARTWYQGNRRSAHRPPPGEGWSRSGLTYVVGIDEVRFAEPIIQHQ